MRERACEINPSGLTGETPIDLMEQISQSNDRIARAEAKVTEAEQDVALAKSEREELVAAIPECSIVQITSFGGNEIKVYSTLNTNYIVGHIASGDTFVGEKMYLYSPDLIELISVEDPRTCVSLPIGDVNRTFQIIGIKIPEAIEGEE